MTDATALSRRSILGGAAALAALPLFRASPSLAQALKITLGVGLVNDGAPLVFQMQRERLLEKAAEELGLGAIETEYLNFPVLLRMLQGIAAGQLQIGMLGSTPTIRNLAQQQPAVPIALAGGGLNFPLQVPPGSPIKNLDGLRGKMVLTIAGSDLHLTLAHMLKAHFGNDDFRALGITVRNINAVTELGRAQPGIDAVVSLDPLADSAQRAGDLITVLNNNGTTGPAYEGPEGRGAGHTIASFRNAPFAPEAYYPHRIWWVAREDFMRQTPNAVVALLVANQRAIDQLAAMNADQVIDIAAQHWMSTRESQRPYVDGILWRRRGWSWITEGDARTLIGLSQTRSIFQQAITAETVRRVMSIGAPLARQAWERAGMKPPMAAFTDPNARDVRGRPVWELEQWRL
jgi:ABC-type nitrate/sulfonate/bicarbonate transport system substrate-binding protein